MKRPGAARRLLLAAILAAPLGGDALAADLWRWIDADGVPRYTPSPDRVPAAQRSTLERVEPGMARAPARALAQAPAIFAPPGDPALAADPFNEPERARELEAEAVEEGAAVESEVVVETPAGTPAPVAPGSAGPGEVRPVDAAPAASADAPPTARVDAAPAARVDAPPATPASEAPARPAPERAARRAPPPPQPVPEPAAPAASDALVPAHEAAASEAALPALRDFEGEIVVDVPSIEPVGASPGAGLEPIAPVGAGPVTTTGIPASAAERAARRAELVAAIARDEEALKAHVSSPDAGPLVASPELRAIAERLPALQAELRALDAQSASP